MTKPRHEIKIFINLADYYAIRNRLSHIAKRDLNSNLNNTYQIRSLYFDNFNDKVLFEKINGYNRREKFRIRFYNHDLSYIRLEKKSKMNSLCYKEGVTITKEQCKAILRNDIQWMLQSDNKLLHEFYTKIKNQLLRGKTVVDYTREAYIYQPGNVRVTIDSDIRSGLFSKDFLQENLSTLSTAVEKVIILEVKYDEFIPEIITDAIQLKNRQKVAVSKYAACRLIGG